MGAEKIARVALRPMLPDDAEALVAVFIASIETLTGDDYDIGQRAAWSAAADDGEAFGQRLAGWLTLVAVLDGEPVGFASLQGIDRIRMLYVHPRAIGQGVATALCDALEKLAGARGAKTLTVEASDTAQDFFAKRGYTAKQRNTHQLGDEWLGNTLMDKSLDLSVRDTRH